MLGFGVCVSECNKSDFDEVLPFGVWWLMRFRGFLKFGLSECLKPYFMGGLVRTCNGLYGRSFWVFRYVVGVCSWCN